MKLLTRELLARFREIGSQESKGDEALVLCKLFTPDSSWTFWMLEYSEEDRTFFGLVQGHEVELGYVALEELESLRGPLGLRVERDLYWKETTLAKVRERIESLRA